MMPEQLDPIIPLTSLLDEITKLCQEAIADTTTRQRQEELRSIIVKQKEEYQKTLAIYLQEKYGLHKASEPSQDEKDEEQSFRELLTFATYPFEKISQARNYGLPKETLSLPTKTFSEDEIRDIEEKTTSSAHATAWFRAVDDGRLLNRKYIDSEAAELEIVAAECYRFVLGKSCTSHGKVTVNEDQVTGMCTEAIPGFIPMRKLTDIAKTDNPEKVLNETIAKVLTKTEQLLKDFKKNNPQQASLIKDWDKTNIEQSLTELDRTITVIKAEAEKIQDENAAYPLRVLAAQLEEQKNSYYSWKQVKELGLIDAKHKTVAIEKISGVVASSLCTAFFFQDWDRHKDNFGISSKDGKLAVASLDYDKSFSGIFGQDNKAFDWKITPKRLRNFPEFKCWYWPTTSNKWRSKIIECAAKLAGKSQNNKYLQLEKDLKEKLPKMYSEGESQQYSALKTSESFQKQARVEWLKMIFIPKELYEQAVKNLAGSKCDQRLKDMPKKMEERRESLFNAALQLHSFREAIGRDDTLDQVKRELKESLSPEEFSIVDNNWDRMAKDIRDKAARITQVLNGHESDKVIRIKLKTELGLNFTKSEVTAMRKEVASIKKTPQLKEISPKSTTKEEVKTKDHHLSWMKHKDQSQENKSLVTLLSSHEKPNTIKQKVGKVSSVSQAAVPDEDKYHGP